jgi:hypothetical protein
MSHLRNEKRKKRKRPLDIVVPVASRDVKGEGGLSGKKWRCPLARTRQSVERELAQQRASLNRIEEKIAIYTELEAPVHLLNQRDQIRDRIAQLEEWLRSGQLPEEAEGMPGYPSMAAFAPTAVLSLLIIALSFDLICLSHRGVCHGWLELSPCGSPEAASTQHVSRVAANYNPAGLGGGTA